MKDVHHDFLHRSQYGMIQDIERSAQHAGDEQQQQDQCPVWTPSAIPFPDLGKQFPQDPGSIQRRDRDEVEQR